MTANERLFVSGLMDEFDKAVEARNVDRIRSILNDVELTGESIGPVLEQMGL